MGYGRRWKPSKTQAREFSQQMKKVEEFCIENGINSSLSSDSYYFSLNSINYRVSNHSIEASNRGAYDEITMEQKRELYHDSARDNDTVYIHASKTRIIEIYNNLKNGVALDGRGNPKKAEVK